MIAYYSEDYNSAIKCFKKIPAYKNSKKLLIEVKNAKYQLQHISSEDRKLMHGCWYMTLKGGKAGKFIAINTSKKARELWTEWDYSYSKKSNVLKEYKNFKKMSSSQKDYIINNGDGTYSCLSGEIKLFTFKISSNSLKVTSVFYDSCFIYFSASSSDNS